MLFVENFNTDPYCNHALEEWLMENYHEDCFMLWRNQKSILLGRNQNAYDEINLPYAKEHGIKIVRRITGGGAVFTDEGNLMFTFISCKGRRDFINFGKFTEPILSALQALGVPAEFSGRNDLTINGGKFSGNAQCIYRGKLLHHGTLMYTANTSELVNALKVREIKLRDKGVASVKSRITNISTHMSQPMDIEDFRAYLFNFIMEKTDGARLLRLSEEDWEQVKVKAAEKYATQQWIFGRSPAYNLKSEKKLLGGIVQIYLNVAEGRIADIRIFGDFFGHRDMGEIEESLVGVLYDENAVREALAAMSAEEFFGNIALSDLVEVIINTN